MSKDTLRARAMALFTPPFKFNCGYIQDQEYNMVADKPRTGDLRVRGWGRISYMPDAEALQDEVGAVIADALTEYWNRRTAHVEQGGEAVYFGQLAFSKSYEWVETTADSLYAFAKTRTLYTHPAPVAPEAPTPVVGSIGADAEFLNLLDKHRSSVAFTRQERLDNLVTYIDTRTPAGNTSQGVVLMRDDTFTVIPQNMEAYKMSVREASFENDLCCVAFDEACKMDKPTGGTDEMLAWDFFKYGWAGAVRCLAAPPPPAAVATCVKCDATGACSLPGDVCRSPYCLDIATEPAAVAPEQAGSVDARDLPWRRLALQFDDHRMQALGHLRCMVTDADKHRAVAEAFLSAAPLNGEAVLAERIKALSTQPDQSALQAAEEALTRCYDVTDFPGDGSSLQDKALVIVRAALAKVAS